MQPNFEIADGVVVFQISETVYSLQAVMKAAYAFMDRFYLLLDDPSPGRIEVRLRPKTAEADLQACVGEFTNELLNQALRLQISRETKALREMIVGRALLTCQGRNDAVISKSETYVPEQSAMSAQDSDYDSLGIATNWTEKVNE